MTTTPQPDSHHDSLDCCMQWGVRVCESIHGRGIIASTDLSAGSLVACCPAVLVPRHDLNSDTLAAYVFEWPDGANTTYALLGGIGCFFNHHASPNIGFRADLDKKLMRFHSLRAIAAGEECCINYDYNPEYSRSTPHLAWYRQLGGEGEGFH